MIFLYFKAYNYKRVRGGKSKHNDPITPRHIDLALSPKHLILSKLIF